MTALPAAGAPARWPSPTGMVDVIEAIGRDRALTPGELSSAVRRHHIAVRHAWAAYERQWARFCGASLDPQFWRFETWARQAGAPNVMDGAPVIVVGTGPSLAPSLDRLRRVRDQVHLVTSSRGAEALLAGGLVPDLVIVEHQTPLDAHFSVQELSHRPNMWQGEVPWIATDSRTPAALVRGAPRERVVVLDPLPTWGLWPATAVAVALRSGAQSVGLLGIDLGTADVADARQRPLIDLLGLLAIDAPARCADLGVNNARKAGWTAMELETLIAGGAVRRPLEFDLAPLPLLTHRRDAARAAWQRLQLCADEAAAALALAVRVRDGDQSPAAVSAVSAALERLLAFGADPGCRLDVQEELGCAFLPRYWRTPPETSLGALLWRPVALTAHELVQQHRTLDGILREGSARL